MRGSIRVSPKHGLNPSILKCPVCGGDAGLALNGHLPGDQQAQREVLDVKPCDSCTAKFDEYKTQGFILFVIADEFDHRQARGDKVPVWPFFRELHIINFEAVDRIFKDIDKSHGCAFISESVVRQLGFPKPEVPV